MGYEWRNQYCPGCGRRYRVREVAASRSIAWWRRERVLLGVIAVVLLVEMVGLAVKEFLWRSI